MSTLENTDVDTESGSARPRRPDRAVYVPRALRAPDADDARPPDTRPPDARRADRSPRSPAPREPAPGTPRRAPHKQFCNVYTPPPLRDKPAPAEPPGDAAGDGSFRVAADGDNFYIGDYFANGQLGFYRPTFYDYGSNYDESWGANESGDLTMALRDAPGERLDSIDDIIDRDYLYRKDEDAEADELKRASQEINRSGKRIIKQSFDSDVLVISDPVEEAPGPERASPADGAAEAEPEASREAPPEARAALRRDENDWDAVFDDSGECLDPSLLEELTATVGRVSVSRARRDYAPYRPGDEAFAHVLEVFDFPADFHTNDLLAMFSEYKDTGFEIKWVDDTHALIVFSSARIAAEVLAAPRSLARCRPLHAATLESRNKAKKCAEFLQPYRQRPETCTALARRLVSGALGVRLSTAPQERAEERRLLSRAREKKRQAALHKEAAWDGSLANTSLDA
ncbi:R3H and coiled-coil domain-containing protein 1 [Pararge aegeria]|nr:R3H and coiled-coil domain-containing protein 1 [Pararge aegeria]